MDRKYSARTLLKAVAVTAAVGAIVGIIMTSYGVYTGFREVTSYQPNSHIEMKSTVQDNINQLEKTIESHQE